MKRIGLPILLAVYSGGLASLAGPVRGNVRAYVVEPRRGLKVAQWSGQVRVVVRLQGLPGGNPPWVAVHIRRPEGGPVIPLPLRDNGAPQFGDEKAGDGLHSAYFRACETAGRYSVVAIIVKYKGQGWRFPCSVSWQVTPADPVDIELRPLPAPGPDRAKAAVKLTSKFSGSQRCQVSTSSGCGKIEPSELTLAPLGSAELSVTYGPTDVSKLKAAGKVTTEGFWVRRGKLSDTIVVLAYPRGKDKPAERMSLDFSLPVQLPPLAKWRNSIAVAALIVLILIIVDHRVPRPHLWWTVAVYDLVRSQLPEDTISARQLIESSRPVGLWRPDDHGPCHALTVGPDQIGDCGLQVESFERGDAVRIIPVRGGGVKVLASGKVRLRIVGERDEQRRVRVYTEALLLAGRLLLHLQPPADEELLGDSDLTGDDLLGP